MRNRRISNNPFQIKTEQPATKEDENTVISAITMTNDDIKSFISTKKGNKNLKKA